MTNINEKTHHQLNSKMTLSEFEDILNSRPAFMLYFYNDICGVCKTLLPKVKSLTETEFPEILFIQLNTDTNRELAGQLRMLSVPGIILFMDGKEIFRSNGMISMDEFKAQIARPYQIMFD
ncbi:MAG: thioredoxin family protein [Bacteroidales bacterium]